MNELSVASKKEWEQLSFYRRLLETTRVMKHSYENADHVLRLLLKEGEERLKQQSTCRECTAAWCCRQVVYITVVEGLMLTKGLAGTKWDGRAGASELIIRGREQMASTTGAWFTQNVPCQFLEDGRCTVYAYRPLACRRYYVWTYTDRDHGCSPSAILKGTRPGEMATTELLRGTMPVYHRLQELWGWDYAVGPLPLVVGLITSAVHTGIEKLPEIIKEENLKPPALHELPLGLLWPGVAVKPRARRKR
jgi:Fe-S-cluster containining protein